MLHFLIVMWTGALLLFFSLKVISALKKAVECSGKEALEYATIVDRDVSSVVTLPWKLQSLLFVCVCVSSNFGKKVCSGKNIIGTQPVKISNLIFVAMAAGHFFCRFVFHHFEKFNFRRLVLQWYKIDKTRLLELQQTKLWLSALCYDLDIG